MLGRRIGRRVDDLGQSFDGPVRPLLDERAIDVEHLEEGDTDEAVLGIEVAHVDPLSYGRGQECIEVGVGRRFDTFDRTARWHPASEHATGLRERRDTRSEDGPQSGH